MAEAAAERKLHELEFQLEQVAADRERLRREQEAGSAQESKRIEDLEVAPR